MLPKINRLTKKRDFDSVFQKGKTVKGRFFICRFAANGLTESRFGFVVSKKISNRAVVRNRIRRRLRSAIQRELANFSKGIDVVVVTLPPIKEASFGEIQDFILDFTKKL